MQPSSSILLAAAELGVYVSGLLSATQFVLLPAEMDISAVHVHLFQFSRPQLQVGDGASFSFLDMWTLSRLWPVQHAANDLWSGTHLSRLIVPGLLS